MAKKMHKDHGMSIDNIYKTLKYCGQIFIDILNLRIMFQTRTSDYYVTVEFRNFLKIKFI